MKVIRRGKKNETARITCGICGSLLEIMQEDIQREQRGPHMYDIVQCPVCEHKMDVHPDQLFTWEKVPGYWDQ